MKELIKYIVAIVLRSIWHVFGIFMPLKPQQILFDSFIGKQYSCNPRAIYEHMVNSPEYENYTFIWAFKNPEKYQFLTNNKNTIVCKYRSFKHCYYSFTSGVVVFNFTRTNELPLRRKQMRIQTWHGGGCYKKAGKGIGYNSSIHNWILNQKAKNDITHYVSSSDYFSENVIKEQYAFEGPILSTGMPRNDIFFDKARIAKVRKEFRSKYNIPEDKFVLLYAPTFRDNGNSYEEIDCNMLRDTLHEKFGKDVVILYRGHHFSSSSEQKKFDIDVSDYMDMQDVLAATDMLISDYSSSIWDYSFIGNPCMLYVPDLEEYRAYRGFDKDIELWGFPVCVSNEALESAINAFDIHEHSERMSNHHKDLDSFENGTATVEICKCIDNWFSGEKK